LSRRSFAEQLSRRKKTEEKKRDLSVI